MQFFIECTQTHQTTFNSGIQRVVRSIVKASMSEQSMHVSIPVIYEAGKFVGIKTAISFPKDAISDGHTPLLTAPLKMTIKSRLHGVVAQLAKTIPYPWFVRFLYAPRDQFGLAGVLFFPTQLKKWLRRSTQTTAYISVAPMRGDVLILLDSSWRTEMWKTVDAWRRKGVVVVVVIYDLIPLLQPRFCTPGVIQAYNAWLSKAVPRADALIGISHTTAVDIQTNLLRFVKPAQTLPWISYFWLGSELDGEQAPKDFDESANVPLHQLHAVCASDKPTYVYVSTIEPRKNHAYALAAFDLLWQQGIAANFLIVGRIGWDCAEFINKVQHHAQFNQQLFMFNDVDDNGLAHIYSTVQGLIFTSFAEGFGLPVIEGLQRGLPVFASDIPVFREIGQTGVKFVDLSSPKYLTDALLDHIAHGAQRLDKPIAWLTWQQSTLQLQQRIAAGVLAKTGNAGKIVEPALENAHSE
jgi:glycosyltransferase involved in cell wall biosynthesis